MKRYKTLIIIGSLSFVFCAPLTVVAISGAPADSEEWKAPRAAGAKENPAPADAKSVASGKTAYTQQCFACHGAAGKGDGPAAVALPKKPGDLSDPKMRDQTDGGLFWKVTTGKTPMPAYEKLLNDQQRWDVINYVRTLEAKK